MMKLLCSLDMCPHLDVISLLRINKQQFLLKFSYQPIKVKLDLIGIYFILEEVSEVLKHLTWKDNQLSSKFLQVTLMSQFLNMQAVAPVGWGL